MFLRGIDMQDQAAMSPKRKIVELIHSDLSACIRH